MCALAGDLPELSVQKRTGQEGDKRTPIDILFNVPDLVREDGAAVPAVLDALTSLRITRADGAEFQQWFGRSSAAEATRFLSAPGRYRLDWLSART